MNNGGDNEFSNQNHEIQELSEQIASLYHKVRCLQCPTGRKDCVGAPHWRRAKLARVEYSMANDIDKELPKFDGSFLPNEFVNWLNTLERVFECHVISNEMKVKLVSKHLQGRAYDWWTQLQVSRQGRGKGKIRDWDKMKKKLKEQFLPFNHTIASSLTSLGKSKFLKARNHSPDEEIKFKFEEPILELEIGEQACECVLVEEVREPYCNDEYEHDNVPIFDEFPTEEFEDGFEDFPIFVDSPKEDFGDDFQGVPMFDEFPYEYDENVILPIFDGPLHERFENDRIVDTTCGFDGVPNFPCGTSLIKSLVMKKKKKKKKKKKDLAY